MASAPVPLGVRAVWDAPPGVAGWLAAVNHKPVGTRFVVTALVFFLIGGVEALLLRIQLGSAESTFLDPELYNQIFTMHGTTMMFLFAVPFAEGLAGYLLPLMLGARDLPFPRLNAFNYWTYLSGGVLLHSSFLFGTVPDSGWFAYPPLAGPEFSPGAAMDFWYLGITLVEIAAIGAAIEIIVSVLRTRAPGMSLNRIPLFGWAMLTTAVMILFAFTPLVVGTVLMEMDRKFGTLFYDAAGGGSALLWQHLFWFFGHPEVYIMLLPATGIVSALLPAFARRPVAAYALVVAAIIATAILSFGLWVHHMYATGLPLLGMVLFAAASLSIAIPSGVQVFAWLATIWRGRPVWTVPMLYTVGFIATFTAGGITGVMVAVVPFDWQAHDTYFVVAHFHYVIIGGVVFPTLAAVAYWFPKRTGRLLDERLGKIAFWLIFAGFNVTFFPQHIVGLLGMPRRVYTYPEDLGWAGYNLVSTIGAAVLAAGVLLFVANVALGLARGPRAGGDPWSADGLEWTIASPPRPDNFARLPVIRSRHPRWDAGRAGGGGPGVETGGPDPEAVAAVDLVEALPAPARATLTSSVLDARPREILILPGPTRIPLAMALGLAIGAAALLGDLFVASAAGGLIALVALLAWGATAERERRKAVEALPGAPTAPSARYGHRGVGWWGTLLLVAVLGTALATLLFSYGYLGLESAAWPPAGVEAPGVGVPLLGIAALVAAAPAAFLAGRAAGRGRRRGVRLWLTAAAVAGVAGLAGLVGEIARAPFGLDDHAYGSSFHVTLGALAAVSATALGVSAWVLVRERMGMDDARLAVLARCSGLLWYLGAASAPLVLLVLHLSPRLV